ncbi:hypothetical protein GCM10010411_75570 [Actinomadura fulvescens]|uniref:Uncharacterized protein n=1 Tax=Actinomadura fulvescens TaxID=46160 RepID=A0ABP6CV98_9ACTN
MIFPAGGREPVQIASRAYGQPDFPARFGIALLSKITELRAGPRGGHTIHATNSEEGWGWTSTPI